MGVARDEAGDGEGEECFQYPRRIECGCGYVIRGTVDVFQRLSVSSADRVWVWRVVGHDAGDLRPDFQYPRRIECGCGPAWTGAGATPRSLSVSSADRVWVWRHLPRPETK